MEENKVIVNLDLEADTECFEDVGKQIAAWFEDHYDCVSEMAETVGRIQIDREGKCIEIYLGNHVYLSMPLDKVEQLIAAAKKV